MANEVKGLKVGDKVFAVTFNSNDLPPDGGFKGWIIDHQVVDIINDTTVKLEMVKNPSKSVVFDFKDDTVNYLYASPEKNGWYTGIFTDVSLFFDQYKEIYAKVKGNEPIKKETENV